MKPKQKRMLRVDMTSYRMRVVYASRGAKTCTITNELKMGPFSKPSTPEVDNIALTKKFIWEVEVYVRLPDNDTPGYVFQSSEPVLLEELEEYASAQKEILHLEFPDCISWGWNARIVATPF